MPNCRHLEWLRTHVRIENRFFDGAPDPTGGPVRPGLTGAPGHEPVFRREDAEAYRSG